MNTSKRQTSRPTPTPTQRIIRALETFHAIVDGSTIDQLSALVPPELPGSGFNMQFEAAWALLHAFATTPVHDDDECDTETESDLEALLALMPAFRTWMRYLDSFPAGDDADAFRKERKAFVLRWYVHVHPNRDMLAQYAKGLTTPTITAHIAGPHYCVHCQNTIASFRPATNEQRIAALTPDEPAITWRIRDEKASYSASFIDDAGYLHVFLLPEDQHELASAQFEATVLLESGLTLNGTLAYPEHSVVGVNFGKLGPLGIDEIVGMDIEKPTNRRT